MDTKTKDVVNQLNGAEKERLELAHDLGLTIQKDVVECKTEWQVRASKEWIAFDSGKALADHLAEKHGLFKAGFSIFSHSDFWMMKQFCHRIERYPQRIPMGVLVKYKEAKESGLFKNFVIIDPNLRVMKCDPFLVGIHMEDLYSDTNCTLICQWEDKTA